MVKVDLITGFLGSGKTTFIKKYAAWLMSQGQNIGILENDFGAVNVDMMLLHDLEPVADRFEVTGSAIFFAKFFHGKNADSFLFVLPFF